MRVRLTARVAASAVALSAGVLLFAAPAGAIQTTTWGIQPASRPGPLRSTLQYPSNGQTVHDAVVVYNRTSQPEVIDLSVLTASYANSTYQFTTARSGLTAGISLATNQVHLGPHQQATVPVIVKLPRHSKVTAIAAIAAEGAPVKQGALLVQQRLVLLVKATPSTAAAPLVPDIGLWGPAAAVLLAVVAALAVREARRRRTPEISIAAVPSKDGAASRQVVRAGG